MLTRGHENHVRNLRAEERLAVGMIEGHVNDILALYFLGQRKRRLAMRKPSEPLLSPLFTLWKRVVPSVSIIFAEMVRP